MYEITIFSEGLLFTLRPLLFLISCEWFTIKSALFTVESKICQSKTIDCKPSVNTSFFWCILKRCHFLRPLKPVAKFPFGGVRSALCQVWAPAKPKLVHLTMHLLNLDPAHTNQLSTDSTSHPAVSTHN